MKALSIRAPWWWFILYGGKDIENRDWATGYRGPILLHASGWWKTDEVTDDAFDANFNVQPVTRRIDASKLAALRLSGGHIIGKVDIVDCVSNSESPWFQGKFGLVLRNPVPFNCPIPFKGCLGLFDVPDALVIGRSAGAIQ